MSTDYVIFVAVLVPLLAALFAFHSPAAGMVVTGLVMVFGGIVGAVTMPVLFAAAGLSAAVTGFVLIALGGAVAAMIERLDRVNERMASQPAALADAILDAMDRRYGRTDGGG